MDNVSTPNSAAKPLSGLRVLELARILAGPWVGQLLADLGADVVKVESPEGDDTRKWGPPFLKGVDGADLSAAYFHACNRGKRSVAANFSDPQDLAFVKKLASHADIVIENFKVGGLRKFGLDAESLRATNPGLIYASITGFGQTGPNAERAGYDFMIQGMAGAMSITGEADGLPQKAGYASADIFTGMYATVGILAALRSRDSSGQGATLDLALFDTQAAVLANQAMNYLVSGLTPGRMGNAHPNIVPYAVYPAADGHIIIATGNDRQFRDAMAAIDAPELATEPLYASNADRVLRRDDLSAKISAATARLPRDVMLARLEMLKVPAGPINTIADVFAEPQAIARGIRVDMPAPHVAGGVLPTVRGPILIDGAPMVAERTSPELNADALSVRKDPAWGGSGF